MIASLGDKATCRRLAGRVMPVLPTGKSPCASSTCSRAYVVQDVRQPPAKRLAACRVTGPGQHGIRIDDRQRPCFVWRDGHAQEGEIVDYREGHAVRITTHPGEVLREEFLIPRGLRVNALALHVPAMRINDIVHGRHAIPADTAARLSRYFGTTTEFWLNLQVAHDGSATLGRHHAEVERIRPAASPQDD